METSYAYKRNTMNKNWEVIYISKNGVIVDKVFASKAAAERYVEKRNNDQKEIEEHLNEQN